MPQDVQASVSATMRSLALQPRKSQRNRHVKAEPDEVRFDSLLHPSPEASALVADWQASRGCDLSLSEALLFEAKWASGAAAVVHQLPAGLAYLKVLHATREQAAFAVYAFARQVNWRRPVLFVQALRVARGYLRDVVGHAESTPEHRRREFTGRLGVSTVLMSRFDHPGMDDIDEAIAAIELSLEQGNDPATAVPYLLEAGVLKFDRAPDPAALMALLKRGTAQLSGDEFGRNPAAQLAACDVYLRLASFAGGKARAAAVDRAASCVRLAFENDPDPDDEVRALMLETLINLVQEDHSLIEDGATVGLQIPFGARNAQASPLLKSIAADLTEAIIDRAFAGDLLARGVCADLLAVESGGGHPETLRRIVELRRGARNHPGLSDERSVLLGIRDQLLLASLDGREGDRAQQLEALVSLALRDPTSASPLLLLAQDVEACGPVRQLGRLSDKAGDIAHWLVSGDWASLLARAAERALASPDLVETSLGGRSEVTTVGDFYGLVSQNFIVKKVSAIGLEREAERIGHLERAIELADRSSEYGVSQHLVAFDLDAETKRSVRRYVPGEPVADAVLRAPLDERRRLLVQVANFLAFMNGVEPASPERVRKELREKEVCRWLRAVGIADPLGSFDSWWSLVADVPLTRRRDAHLDNWVLANDGRILAIDLEAIGSRPLGYELAQITDDGPVLEPEDWVSRRQVCDGYIAGLEESLDVDPNSAWESYQASVAARALRRLTWDLASPVDQSHAQATLDWLSTGAESPMLRAWIVSVLAAWRSSRGLSGLASGELVIDGHLRRRISKAMAYHLRHGVSVEIDEDGWASIQELKAAVGTGVTERQIAIVASTLSDPRFEFRDGLVRARYGHSRPVPGAGSAEGRVDFATKAFHATTVEAAACVIEAGQGVRPMSRMFVHLSRSASEAVLSGLRHGYPLLLSTDSQRTRNLISRGGNTLVALAVPLEGLQVEPLATHWALLPPVPMPK